MRRVVLSLMLIACVSTLFAKSRTTSVMARKNALDPTWAEYQAQTVDALKGFKPSAEPQLNRYGAWTDNRVEATGFFRVERLYGRWWIIDPEGYPYYHRGVAAFNQGSSDNQIAAAAAKYGGKIEWARQECAMLKSYGFNGAGAWSDVDAMRQIDAPLIYTVIVNPMGDYKRQHIKAYGGKYLKCGWQGYRFDLAMVFDDEFEEYVEASLAPISKYRDDKYLLGYYTDNELPWRDDALDRHLTLLAKDEAGYIAAKAWLEQRKGEGATIESITDEDREAFTGYYFETYMKKVTTVLKRLDPNHLYLGCRFNQDKDQELTNPEIFRVAGKYMDIISINHYRKWQPIQEQMNQWGSWSNRPFLITEWYVKGEDTDLPNKSGAGWNVATQYDRGLFYQNFTIELLRNPNCVGWDWFRYQDNDPHNLKTDISNRDSNKGVVDSQYNIYKPLLELAKEINTNVYNLINYFTK